jgi:hypothetical protein
MAPIGRQSTLSRRLAEAATLLLQSKAGVASADARIMTLQACAQILGSLKNYDMSRRVRARYDNGAAAVPHGPILAQPLYLKHCVLFSCLIKVYSLQTFLSQTTSNLL